LPALTVELYRGGSAGQVTVNHDFD
jgi:hypothetical protein